MWGLVQVTGLWASTPCSSSSHAHSELPPLPLQGSGRAVRDAIGKALWITYRAKQMSGIVKNLRWCVASLTNLFYTISYVVNNKS